MLLCVSVSHAQLDTDCVCSSEAESTTAVEGLPSFFWIFSGFPLAFCVFYARLFGLRFVSLPLQSFYFGESQLCSSVLSDLV